MPAEPVAMPSEPVTRAAAPTEPVASAGSISSLLEAAENSSEDMETSPGPTGCKNCGEFFTADAIFCRSCGQKRDADQCPSCGNVYMPDALFCRNCGQKRTEVSDLSVLSAPTPAPVVTVQGGMSGGDDDDSSEGEGPTRLSAVTNSSVASAAVTAPATVSQKTMLKSMLGEDSDEDDAEEDASAARPRPSALSSLAPLGKAAAKAKSSPWTVGSAAMEADSDSEDIEEALKKDLAAHSPPSRGSSAASLTGPAKPDSSLRPSVGLGGSTAAGKPQAPKAEVPEGSSSWDEGSSIGSPSPTAKQALGIESPASSVASSPSAAKAKAKSPAAKAAAKVATSPAGSRRLSRSPSGATNLDEVEDEAYDSDEFDEEDDLPI